MLTCRFENEPELFADGAGAEEHDHDEGVWEADFGAVDEAIADGFDEDEGLVVFGVEDDFLEFVLEAISVRLSSHMVVKVCRLGLLVGHPSCRCWSRACLWRLVCSAPLCYALTQRIFNKL